MDSRKNDKSVSHDVRLHGPKKSGHLRFFTHLCMINDSLIFITPLAIFALLMMTVTVVAHVALGPVRRRARRKVEQVRLRKVNRCACSISDTWWCWKRRWHARRRDVWRLGDELDQVPVVLAPPAAVFVLGDERRRLADFRLVRGVLDLGGVGKEGWGGRRVDEASGDARYGLADGWRCCGWSSFNWEGYKMLNYL